MTNNSIDHMIDKYNVAITADVLRLTLEPRVNPESGETTDLRLTQECVYEVSI